MDQIQAGRGATGEAERWFRRFAEAGDAEGVNNYAVLLHRRNADLREVLRWLKVAADGGIPDAALNLRKLSAGPM